MILLTIILATAVYALLIALHGTAVTPDGHVYSAMGRGAIVPRPYAYRMLPRVIGNMWAWRGVHAASYLAFAVCAHLIGERFGLSGTIVSLACLTLPALRQSVTWPALLDMPMLATASLCAVIAPTWPILTACIVAFSVLVHERAPVLCAIYAAPFMEWGGLGIAVAVAGLFVLQAHDALPSHPDEHNIDWLRDPIGSAIAKHRPTVYDWKVWVRPLGALPLAVISGGWWLWLSLAFGYGGCLMAQDRARIYSVACLPLAVYASLLTADYALLIPFVNWFTINNEV